VKTFKLSRDPHFLQKLTDVVGLYLNPPEKAIGLCVEEKSRIQALDPTPPGLPMKQAVRDDDPRLQNATGPPRCWPLWNWRKAKSWESVINGIDIRNS
jgi:hypothetical protein